MYSLQSLSKATALQEHNPLNRIHQYPFTGANSRACWRSNCIPGIHKDTPH